MEPLVMALVIAAALLHAGWNALAKKGGDPLVRMALIAGGSALCGVPLIVAISPPARTSWPMLLGSAVVHQAYYACLVLGYRHGDLSTVYPIARGGAPLLVAIGAAVVAGEVLDPIGIVAVVIVSLAVASLAVGGGDKRQRRAVGYALASAVTIAVYSVIDGLGGRAAGDGVISYVSWLFVLQGLPIVVFTAIRRRASMRQLLAKHWRGGLGGGAAAFVAYGLVIWAMSLTPMSYVAALREISVVIAALIGTRLLGEPFGRRRVIAAAAVAFGIVLLQVTR
jgi:drug/metabolite transporter (DMT)-like permease